MSTSEIKGFYNLPLEEKLKKVAEFSSLDENDLELMKKYRSLPDYSELENNVGPFKIATNFLVNGIDYLVPMDTEEPSVVAAASRAAKLIRLGGGFTGEYLDSKMIGQIQLIEANDFSLAKKRILDAKKELLTIANETNNFIFENGGGAKDIEVEEIETEKGKNLVVHLSVDTLDAMGANIVNTMLEAISPRIIELSSGKANLKIISNFASKRVVRVVCKVPLSSLCMDILSGEEIATRIVHATALAKADIYRSSTHNKGIMNGIDAVILATGNDYRAIEAGVHSYAAKNGKYSSVTDWWIEGMFLNGKIEVPMAVGIVGGATGLKKSRLALKILGVKSAKELGIICASVGMANNLAALSAIVTDGIQKGHMELHRKFIEGKNK
jgi:hydroxymethylglutaryl-CoA reductase